MLSLFVLCSLDLLEEFASRLSTQMVVFFAAFSVAVWLTGTIFWALGGFYGNTINDLSFETAIWEVGCIIYLDWIVACCMLARNP